MLETLVRKKSPLSTKFSIKYYKSLNASDSTVITLWYLGGVYSCNTKAHKMTYPRPKY